MTADSTAYSRESPRRSAEKMKIYCERMICNPLPENEAFGMLYQGEVVYFALSLDESAFLLKRDAFLDSDYWELSESQFRGEISPAFLSNPGYEQVLPSLDRHGEFAMILAKHGSDN